MQLAFWTASLAVGILIGISTGWLTSWAVTGIALATFVALCALRARNLGMACLAVACGCWLGQREVSLAMAPPGFVEDKPVEIVGQIVAGADVADASPSAESESSERQPAGGRSSATTRCHLRLAVRSVDGQEISARLTLMVLAGVPNLAPGDWVRFTSRLYAPRGFANPGMPDGRLVARGQGVEMLATVKTSSDLQRVNGPASWMNLARRWAFNLRRTMAQAINRQVFEPAAGFVRTMVLGERSDVPAEVEDGFRAAGATHVLSVSGLHLAVVVALVFQVLRRLLACLPVWFLPVPSKVLASALSLPACAFYTLLTGEAVATVRSAVMASMVLGAAVVNRPVSLSASIAAAAIVLLMQSPLSILDVSFQLSFASVIGLGLFARWLVSRAPSVAPGKSNRALGWLARSLSASFAASLVTAPLVAHHFGEVTPVAPLGNLLLVPLVELVVLPFGLAGSLLGLAHPWLGLLPLWLAGVASKAALGLAEIFRRFAPVLLVRLPDWIETLLLVAAAAFFLQALVGDSRRRRRWLVACAVTLALASATMSAQEIARRTCEDLRVTFLDVGQGDSALVEGPRGFVALVDAGGRYDNSFDTGARIVEPVLRARGITKLDLVVLSHPHPDHMNGLLRILKRFPVGALWTSGDDGNNPVYGNLMALARERGVPAPLPAEQIRNGLTITPLGPWMDGHIGVPPGLGVNDASLVVRLGYVGRCVLLVGDIGNEGESELLEGGSSNPRLACDVLKVPHHGSRYSSSGPFLDAVSPRLAVASAGRFNRFGLPNPYALERYAQRNIPLMRTDRDGAVGVVVRKSGDIVVNSLRNGTP